MQTVQFQCGSCGKLMAVSTEHLGTQVHCPHCMEVVQAPAAAGQEPAPIPEIKAPLESTERESIFGGSEDGQSDDLFGGPGRPLVEMPPVPVPAPQAPAHADAPDGTTAALTNSPRPAAALDDQDAATEEAVPAPRVARQPRRDSLLVPMLLIFLVPYSIVCSIYIGYSLIFPPKPPFDPLERLPDPRPGEGSPRRIDPHAPLPGKLKVSLNRPIQIGDIEVTPLKVERTKNSLVLYLKMTNISRDQIFNPVHDAFVRYTDEKKTKLPYTYLEAGTRLYGGLFEWRLKDPNKEDDDVVLGQRGAERRDIGPGQSLYVLLTTRGKDAAELARMLAAHDRFLWRIQVRRGLVRVRDRDVSATAVIGVQFSRQDIDHLKGAAAASRNRDAWAGRLIRRLARG